MSIKDDLAKVDGLTSEQTEKLIGIFQPLKDNHDALLGEKKTLKAALDQKAGEFDEYKNAQTEAEEQIKIDKAKAEKDIEALQIALQERDDRIKKQQQEVAKRESDNAIEKARNEFLTQISDDPAARHFMSDLFTKGVEHRDGKLVVVKDGKLTGQSVEDFTGSLTGDKSYAAYVKANVGTGGGASGSGSSSGGAAKTWTRDQFENAQQVERAQFFKEGGKLID